MAAPKKKTTTRKTTSKTKTPSRPQKPLISRGTWIALLLLALVAGYTYYLNNKAETEAEATATPAAEIEFVFGNDTGILTSMEVAPAEGETVKVERNSENAWAVTQPLELEADQGVVEAAASQITALTVLDRVDADLDILGLDSPQYTINITFEDGSKHTLEIGDNTPTNKGYYARLDKKDILIVSLSGIDALTNLVNTPPYLYTPTPTPVPSTPTPETTAEAESTPEPAATPTP